jgi:hypothetical protein
MVSADIEHFEREKEFELASVILGLGFDKINAGRKGFGRGAERRPAIAELRHALLHRLRIAPKPNRDAGFLDRLWAKSDILEIDELALELGLFLGPQLDHRGDIFVRHAAALVESHAEDVEFLLEPADAKQGLGPAAGQPVECRPALGLNNRVLQRQDRD